ncbi:MAG: hypothetical protein AABN33_10955 [Acidobacteriota bacterium]
MDEVRKAELALQRARAKQNEEARQRWMAKLEAKKAEAAKVGEKKAEEDSQKAEVTLKRECLYRFLNGGGAPQDFERWWPEIRKQRLVDLAAGTGAPSLVEEIKQRKRASGLYGNLG